MTSVARLRIASFAQGLAGLDQRLEVTGLRVGVAADAGGTLARTQDFASPR